jgi:hypothetical protein
MTLPASGQLDINAIYNEYYETSAPANTDMKELALLYQAPGTVDACISYFYGREVIQGQMWRFQDPWSSAFHLVADSCINSDNNMLALGKYDFIIVFEPSWGGYNGGTIDISVHTEASIGLGGTSSGTLNFYVRCSSNNGVTYPITIAQSLNTGTSFDVNMDGNANIQNITPGTSNLKFQIQQDMIPPSGNWSASVERFYVQITAVHNDQALKVTRLISNHDSIGSSSGNATFETRYVSGVYDFLNWNLNFL